MKLVVFSRLQNSRFRKAGSAVSVILECEAREPHTPAGRLSPSPFFHSLQTFRSSMVRRSRSQKNTAVLQTTFSLDCKTVVFGRREAP